MPLLLLLLSTCRTLLEYFYTRHLWGTHLAQGLYAQKTQCMAGLEPTISWLRAQYLNHSAILPIRSATLLHTIVASVKHRLDIGMAIIQCLCMHTQRNANFCRLPLRRSD